jgi:hypothetical protein
MICELTSDHETKTALITDHTIASQHEAIFMSNRKTICEIRKAASRHYKVDFQFSDEKEAVDQRKEIDTLASLIEHIQVDHTRPSKFLADFNMSSLTFSTYVDENGLVLEALDFLDEVSQEGEFSIMVSYLDEKGAVRFSHLYTECNVSSKKWNVGVSNERESLIVNTFISFKDAKYIKNNALSQ